MAIPVLNPFENWNVDEMLLSSLMWFMKRLSRIVKIFSNIAIHIIPSKSTAPLAHSVN